MVNSGFLYPFCYNKWKKKQVNLKFRDVYHQKEGKAHFRIDKFVEVEKDLKDLVIAVMVAMRRRDSGKNMLSFKSKK